VNDRGGQESRRGPFRRNWIVSCAVRAARSPNDEVGGFTVMAGNVPPNALMSMSQKAHPTTSLIGLWQVSLR